MGLRENSFERIWRVRSRGGQQIALQKSEKRHAAKAQPKAPEEFTAIHAEVDLPAVHSRYTRMMVPPFTAKKTSSLTHSIGARPVKLPNAGRIARWGPITKQGARRRAPFSSLKEIPG